MAKRVEDDGLFDLWLGFFFSFGAGLCVLGIGAVVVFEFFPEHIPTLLIQLLN